MVSDKELGLNICVELITLLTPKCNDVGGGMNKYSTTTVGRLPPGVGPYAVSIDIDLAPMASHSQSVVKCQGFLSLYGRKAMFSELEIHSLSHNHVTGW